jgi:hypothetical protein
MPNAYKTLGNANPGAALTTIYTAPSSTEAVAKFVAANRADVVKTFRMAVSPAGAAIQPDHYWFYDVEIPAHDSVEVDGISMAATDVVKVYGEDDNVSFNLNGVEIT